MSNPERRHNNDNSRNATGPLSSQPLMTRSSTTETGSSNRHSPQNRTVKPTDAQKVSSRPMNSEQKKNPLSNTQTNGIKLPYSELGKFPPNHKNKNAPKKLPAPHQNQNNKKLRQPGAANPLENAKGVHNGSSGNKNQMDRKVAHGDGNVPRPFSVPSMSVLRNRNPPVPLEELPSAIDTYRSTRGTVSQRNNSLDSSEILLGSIDPPFDTSDIKLSRKNNPYLRKIAPGSLNPYPYAGDREVFLNGIRKSKAALPSDTDPCSNPKSTEQQISNSRSSNIATPSITNPHFKSQNTERQSSNSGNSRAASPSFTDLSLRLQRIAEKKRDTRNSKTKLKSITETSFLPPKIELKRSNNGNSLTASSSVINHSPYSQKRVEQRSNIHNSWTALPSATIPHPYPQSTLQQTKNYSFKDLGRKSIPTMYGTALTSRNNRPTVEKSANKIVMNDASRTNNRSSSWTQTANPSRTLRSGIQTLRNQTQLNQTRSTWPPSREEDNEEFY